MPHIKVDEIDPAMPDPPSIGQLIGSRQRYRLEKRLGTGGMADVFLATDTLLGQPVAIKLLRDTLVASEELRKRFEREVGLCAALKSEHIVGVSDCGVTEEGHPFYVMEYLQGQTLGELLQREQRLSIERTLNIVIQVCEGLRLAHEGVTLWRDNATISEQVKVIHRDLKPDNIFLISTSLGELVKILDFGIAKIRNYSCEPTRLTSMFIGTFHYAAPEQLEVEQDLDGRADIYSLGIILYEMLSGTDPFGLGLNARAVSEMSWAVAHTSKPLIPLRSQPGLEEIPPVLEVAVMRCLQKSPNGRFTSIEQLHQALLTAASTSQSSTFVHTDPTIAQSSTARDNDSISNGREGVIGTNLLPEPNSLLPILVELIGPIAPTLLRQVTAKTNNIQELMDNLAPYLSTSQQAEFKQRVMLLLKEPIQPQAKPSNLPKASPSVNVKFITQCEQHLTDSIGPIAIWLIRDVLKSHPQISSVELVNLLSKEIPNSQKANEFRQCLLKLLT